MSSPRGLEDGGMGARGTPRVGEMGLLGRAVGNVRVTGLSEPAAEEDAVPNGDGDVDLDPALVPTALTGDDGGLAIRLAAGLTVTGVEECTPLPKSLFTAFGMGSRECNGGRRTLRYMLRVRRVLLAWGT
jgi:hypothetical protein